MKNEEASLLLNQLILEKEAEHEAEGRLLKEDLRRVAENLRPVNIIKSTFKDLVSSPGLGTSLADSAIGLSAGFIAKKVFVGSSHNLFKKLAGFVVEMVVANKTTKNAGQIKSIAGNLFTKLIGGAQDPEKENG